MKQFTDEEKTKMIEKIDELDIDITMYRKATNVLDLNLGIEDAVEGLSMIQLVLLITTSLRINIVRNS